MCEHLIAKDRIRDLRGMNKVHLKETCLEVTLLGLVVFEGIEQE